MFTAMMQETTTVVSKVGGVLHLSTLASATDNLPLGGASICVDDACMTVSSVRDGWERGQLLGSNHPLHKRAQELVLRARGNS